jgi:hypothetical protein
MTTSRRTALFAVALTAVFSASQALAVGVTYNVPPNAAPLTLLAGETLNLGFGGTVATGFTSNAASVVNVQGGELNFAQMGGEVNLYTGRIGGFSHVLSTGVLTVHGGDVSLALSNQGSITVLGGNVAGSLSTSSGGKLTVKGGTIGPILAGLGSQIIQNGGVMNSSLAPLSGTTLTKTGGAWNGPMQLVNGSTLNLSGGTMAGPLRLDNTAFNLACQSVKVGGVPIPGLVTGAPHIVTQRDTTLSGVLSDGSPFSFVMNTGFTPDGDAFPLSATVRVTLVPEPGGVVHATVCFGLLAWRRRLLCA